MQLEQFTLPRSMSGGSQSRGGAQLSCCSFQLLQFPLSLIVGAD